MYGVCVCAVRNLYKRIIAAGAAAGREGHGAVYGYAVTAVFPVAVQLEGCRFAVVALGHAYFFDVVAVELLIVVGQGLQVVLVIGDTVRFHGRARVGDLGRPVAVEFAVFLYGHEDFIIFAIYIACIYGRAVGIGKDADIAANDVDIAVVDSFAVIRVALQCIIPLQFIAGRCRHKASGCIAACR